MKNTSKVSFKFNILKNNNNDKTKDSFLNNSKIKTSKLSKYKLFKSTMKTKLSLLNKKTFIEDEDEINDSLSFDEEDNKSMYILNNIQIYDIFSFARHNKYEYLESLFEQGLNPDSKDEHGNTILIIAAQNNNKRILKLALRYGAQINMQNIMGNTALHFAKEYQYDNIFKYLIQKGADPEIKNIKGYKAKDGIRPNIQEKQLFLGMNIKQEDENIANIIKKIF
jgi:ankyrin repeat protein